MSVPFSVFCVMFVCKRVMYYCHRVSSQLQLNNYIYIYFMLLTKIYLQADVRTYFGNQGGASSWKCWRPLPTLFPGVRSDRHRAVTLADRHLQLTAQCLLKNQYVCPKQR
jgi:hypothetical protein